MTLQHLAQAMPPSDDGVSTFDNVDHYVGPRSRHVKNRAHLQVDRTRHLLILVADLNSPAVDPPVVTLPSVSE